MATFTLKRSRTYPRKVFFVLPRKMHGSDQWVWLEYGYKWFEGAKYYDFDGSFRFSRERADIPAEFRTDTDVSTRLSPDAIGLIVILPFAFFIMFWAFDSCKRGLGICADKSKAAVAGQPKEPAQKVYVECPLDANVGGVPVFRCNPLTEKGLGELAAGGEKR